MDRVDFLLAEFVFARRPQALRRPKRVGRSMRSDLNVEIDIPAAAAFQQPISTYRCPTDLIPSDFSGANPRNDDANFPLGKSNDVGINDSGNGLKKHFKGLEFTPDLDRGHDGPTVVMRVTDGHFSSRNESAGLSVGPYRVRVTLAAEKTGDALKGETIPSVYQFPFTYSSEPSDSEIVFDLQDSQRR